MNSDAIGPVTSEAGSDGQAKASKPYRGYEGGPRSATGLYQAMRIALIAYIVFEVALQLVLIAYLNFAAQLPDFMFAEIADEFLYADLIGLMYFGVGAVGFFFAARFTYRAMRNLHTINSPAAIISPFWAVAYYFVPFANLVMPANAMSQIYHGTHEAVGEESRSRSPIPLWWTCWLLAGVPQSIADNVSSAPLIASGLYLTSGTLGVVGAVVLIRMGRRISERQEQFMHGGYSTVFD